MQKFKVVEWLYCDRKDTWRYDARKSRCAILAGQDGNTQQGLNRIAKIGSAPRYEVFSAAVRL